MKTTMMLAALMMAAFPLKAQPGPNDGQASGHQERQAMRDDLDRLAQKHGLSRDDLERLRGEGMNWSDIGSAAWLADHAKQPMRDVVDRHQNGTSWDDLAKEYDLDASQMHRGARQFRHDAMQAERSGPHEGRHEQGRGEMHDDHDRLMDQGHDRDMQRDQTREPSHDQDRSGGPHQ